MIINSSALINKELATSHETKNKTSDNDADPPTTGLFPLFLATLFPWTQVPALVTTGMHHWDKVTLDHQRGFFSNSVGKESICNARCTEDMGLIPGWGRFPAGSNGNPLQYSCLENPMDRRAWWATVHGVAQSQTWLSTWHTQSEPGRLTPCNILALRITLADDTFTNRKNFKPIVLGQNLDLLTAP